MSNSSFPVPKYRKHKASGQAVVTLAGRDHYLGPHGTKASRLEYDRLVGEWLAAGRPVTAPNRPCEITVTEVIAAFWRHVKSIYLNKGRPTGTHEKYKPCLKLLRARYGRTLAVNFGPLALKALRLAMIEKGQSRGYVNESIHRIRRVFKWAASEELIPGSIPQALATVEGLRKGNSGARELPPVEPVDDDVVNKTLPFLPQVVADMVRLQRMTGARPGEICSMRPCDVDRSGEVWKYTPAEHKTEHHGHRRMIFLGPKAQAVLRPYLLRPAENHCFSPAESELERRRERHRQRKTPLHQGNVPGSSRTAKPSRAAGQAYTNDSYRRAIHRACESAFNMPKRLRHIAKGIPADERAKLQAEAKAWREQHLWSPHQLRHTAATVIRHRFGLEAAQATLGHSRIDVTEIYAAKNQELATRVAQEVG